MKELLKTEKKRRTGLSEIAKMRGNEVALKTEWFASAAKQVTTDASDNVKKSALLSAANATTLACSLCVTDLRPCLDGYDSDDETPEIVCHFKENCDYGDDGVISNYLDGEKSYVSNLRFTPISGDPVYLCWFCSDDADLRKVAKFQMDWKSLLREFDLFLKSYRPKTNKQ